MGEHAQSINLSLCNRSNRLFGICSIVLICILSISCLRLLCYCLVAADCFTIIYINSISYSNKTNITFIEIIILSECSHDFPPLCHSAEWVLSWPESVRMSVRPWTLSCPHNNWSHIWAEFTKFIPDMHSGTLSAGIKDLSHWLWSSRSFSH